MAVNTHSSALNSPTAGSTTIRGTKRSVRRGRKSLMLGLTVPEGSWRSIQNSRTPAWVRLVAAIL
jgi:hypothetical protein